MQRVTQNETAVQQPDGLDGAALLSALRALRNGDLRVRLPEGEAGLAGHSISLETGTARVVGDWDEARVERIVSNLISNAVKYSPKGGEITLQVRQEVGHQEWAILVVRDNGIGIPPSEVDRVFEPYYRASSTAGTVSGSGIGLAGTRHIVEQHGGHITVQSEVGDTTFTVRLPLMVDSLEVLEA